MCGNTTGFFDFAQNDMCVFVGVKERQFNKEAFGEPLFVWKNEGILLCPEGVSTSLQMTRGVFAGAEE